MNAADLLRDLVSVPSPSGREDRAAELLVRRMEAAGFRARRDGVGNAVGRLGRGPRRLVLLGHLDTVPGGPEVRVEDGVLWGRGAVDAKGPLAVLAAAAAATGPVGGWELEVVGAVGEEADSRGARHRAEGPAPDACVVGEPSGWDALTLGYKGYLAAEYRWGRPTSHGAGPEPSAAERAVGWWNRVRRRTDRFNEGREGVFRRIQARLDAVRSRREGDREAVAARLEFRLPPGVDPGGWRAEVEALEDRGADLCFSRGVPAHRSSRGCAPARALLGGIREAGGAPTFKLKTGTSDMNVVGPAWGCPVVAYGPGDSGLDHTPRERVELDEVRRAVRVLRGALRRLTTGGARRRMSEGDRAGTRRAGPPDGDGDHG